MSGFSRPKKRIDREALERFAEGADHRRQALAATPATDTPPAPVHASQPGEAAAAANDAPSSASTAPTISETRPPAPETRTAKRSNQPEPVAYDKHQQIQWRVSQSTRDLFERVYENTNVKSKQQLLDSILLPALEAMDKKDR